MSALRLSVPGQPTRLIDLGPAVAYVTAQPGGIRGSGTLEPSTGPKVSAPISQARREQMAAYKATHRATCGRPIREGLCARAPGHRPVCRTRAMMERQAMARRSA